MGQQQILLLVLGIIIVGIAIALALILFKTNGIENKRNILVHECMNIGSLAQGYYRRPVSFGGGGNKFTGFQIPGNMMISENGNFEASVSENIVIVTGTGNEVITGTDSIKVQVTVYPDTYLTTIIN